MPGAMTCPVTGKLVKNNRLVDDKPRTLNENRDIIDDKLGLYNIIWRVQMKLQIFTFKSYEKF